MHARHFTRFSYLPSLLLTLFLAFSAEAQPIDLEATSKVTLDPESETVIIEITAANPTSQPAHDIRLSFPRANQSERIIASLAPKEKVVHQASLKFHEVDIFGEGSYTIPYQIIYRDKEFFNGSVAFLAHVVYGEKKPLPITVAFQDDNTENAILLLEQFTQHAAIKNTSEDPLEISSIVPFGPAELAYFKQSDPLPLTLQPKESLAFTTSLSNRGVAVGDSAAVYLIINGEQKDTSFSTPLQYTVTIAEPPEESNTATIVAAVLLSTLLVLTVVFLIKRFLRKEPQETIEET